MKIGLYPSRFHEVFSELLEKYKITRYQITKVTSIDQSYLLRLKNGDSNNLSVEKIMQISLALMRINDKISMHDIEQLFRSVGWSIGV